jgi:hypothetical protein
MPFTYALDAPWPSRRRGRNGHPAGDCGFDCSNGAGLVIIDFKTDRVSENDLAARSERYAQQLRYYAMAAGRFCGSRRPADGCITYARQGFEIKL